MSNNSVVPNSYAANMPRNNASNRNSGVGARHGVGPFNVVYGRQRGDPQVPANPTNTANSHLNVARRRLVRIQREFQQYINNLERQYGTANMIPNNTTRRQIANRVANYQQRIANAIQAIGAANPY